MRQHGFYVTAGLFLLAFPVPFALAEGSAEHEFDWGSRSRYADVAGDNSGKAASVLLRFTLTSDWNSALTSTLEIDHVSSFFKDHHSDGVRFNHQPLIPDPPGTEVNQAFIATELSNLTLKLGRQRVNFDNQRFVGGNGFWQNEQTFDALLGKINLLSNSNFTYSYIINSNRIFGDKGGKHLADDDVVYGTEPGLRPANFWGDHKHRSHLARLEWNEWDYTRIVAYAYAIDNRDMPGTSNDTLGLSYTWRYKAGAINYRAQLESAIQKRPEIADTPNLAYYFADFGVGAGAYEVNGRYEVLGGKNSVSFATPLGSLHNFSGWADEVTNYVSEGLKDFSVGLLWRSSPFRVETRYHTFHAYQNGDALGTEFDFDLTYKPARKHSVSIRVAYFKPDQQLQPLQGSSRKFYLDYAYNL
jgi:hypothetical protein